jgi:signal transduction histidine kinase
MDQAKPIELERFRGVVAIQQAIGDARGDLSTVMDAIVREQSVMPQSNGIVVELRDGDQIYYAAASGTSAELLGLRLPLSTSLSGRCVLTGEPLCCVDSETDPRVNREACRRVGLRSMIVIPIPHRGQTVGVLKYHAAEPAAFDGDDMLMAHLLVGPIAVGMSSVGEEDALRAQTELRSIVELKEQFVSNVSHELRTPVTSIAGSLGLLHNGAGGQLSDQANALVDIASRNAERLKRLVNDLLDIGKLDTGQVVMTLAAADLRQVVQDAVEQNRPFADQLGVTIDCTMPPDPLIATTDADRLFQAITNLISNAAKFSPTGTAVRIALATDGDRATIKVIDQGPGVPASFRAKLFDRFSQSDTRGQSSMPGTGLGLAITKGIVERLGGSVRLDEAYHDGAAFEIIVPVLPAASAAA